MCDLKKSSILDQTNLDLEVVSILKRNHLDTVHKILTKSPSELRQLTNLPHDKITHIISVISQLEYDKNPLTSIRSSLEPSADVGATAVCQSQFKLPAGCPIINNLLKGGFCARGITEIYGSSASGKTQICLQLCLTIQSTLPNAKAIYICTEDAFPSKRLNEMVVAFKFNNPSFKNIAFMDNILVSQIGSCEKLLHCICYKIENVIQSHNVRLLILDSVTATFRCDYDIDQNGKRSRDIQSLGYTLRMLAEKYNLIVICVNQVVENVDNNKPWCRKEDGTSVPALGLVWTNLVFTRIQVSRSNCFITKYKTERGPKECQVPASVCTMKIIYSPYLPLSKINFIVTPNGVEGIKA